MACCGCCAKKKKQKVKRKKSLLVFNILLLCGGLISFITSIVGIVLLEESSDARIPAFSFAKFAPLALGLLTALCALFALLVPTMEKYRRCRMGYLGLLVVVFILIITCGIILVMIPFYSTQAATEDSRNINSGVGSDIRVFANDYSMAIWNVCCEGKYSVDLVRNCDSTDPGPCAGHKEPSPCACIQDQNLFILLKFHPDDCAPFESYRVPAANGTSVPLVGDPRKGGCANGNPKQFQREWNSIFVTLVEPIGIVQLTVGLILLVISAVGLHMMRRNDRRAKRLQDQEKKQHSKQAGTNPGSTGANPKAAKPEGSIAKA